MLAIVVAVWGLLMEKKYKHKDACLCKPIGSRAGIERVNHGYNEYVYKMLEVD